MSTPAIVSTVPLTLISNIKTFLPLDPDEPSAVRQWHWQATLPAIPYGYCMISLLTSIRIVGRPYQAVGFGPALPLSYGTLTYPSSMLSFDGPTVGVATQPPTFFVAVFENADPREIALVPPGLNIDGYSQYAVNPTVRLPYVVLDHDPNWGYGPIVSGQGSAPFLDSTYADFRLNGVLRDYATPPPSPFVDGPTYTYSDPSWRSAVQAFGSPGSAAWLPRPFPATVDWYFQAPYYRDHRVAGVDNLTPINYRIVGPANLVIIELPCLINGQIAALPGPSGIRRRARISGAASTPRISTRANAIIAGFGLVEAIGAISAPPGGGGGGGGHAGPGAVLLDGSSGYVDVPDATALRLGGPLTTDPGTSFSIEVWVNQDPAQTTPAPMVQKYDPALPCGGVGVVLFIDYPTFQGSSGLQSYVGDCASGNGTSSAAPGAGAWHLLTLVYDQSVPEVLLYEDGALVTTQNPTPGGVLGSMTNALSLQFGFWPDARDYGNGDVYFQGLMARVALYDVALDGATIAAHAAAPDSTYDAAIVATTGVVGYWPLNETSGTVAGDLVGSNPGAYIGGVTLGQTGP